ncbi:MAG TPA: excinuclease ABC subunit UvrA [Thermomicrobiales bacterium]|nr:excinuclease ABC subunit UvrA [Thermomicrobiales bacterium]
MADRRYIEVRGARENNLKDVSLDIPKQRITVFTGVSGSGKSSLVFDTIAAEAQRQLNETFTAFVQGFLPSYGQPDLDHIEHLNAPIIIDQKRVGGGSRSTAGTYTDIAALLRLFFSRIGQPSAGPAYAFSFNTPQGMCPECEGIGKTVQLDLEKFLDRGKSLNEGAILHPEFKVGKWMWKMYPSSGLFDNDKPIEDYTDEELHALLYGVPGLKVAEGAYGSKYEGLVERFNRMYISGKFAKDAAAMSDRNRAVFEQFTTSRTCPACHGGRLNEAALNCRINGKNIADLADLEATELIAFLEGFTDPVAQRLAARLSARLRHLVDIGLGYLSLGRETATLSGGESQRLKMIRHLGNSLTEMLYILDEPSVGLHARDVARLTDLLKKLRDKGNTVLVVEHDPDVMAIADHIVDLGPRAGTHGGEVVFQGDFQGLKHADTLTGQFLTRRLPVKPQGRQPTGKMTITNATLHNLKNVTVDIPTGVLTVVTGVAGSGKSTLINDVFLAQHPDALAIDQSRVTANSRSAPATYTGIMDDIRQAFARANQVSASLFSFNSAGSCPNCNGLGVVYTDLAFMAGIVSTCEICEGKRFKPEVLDYHLRGKSISDVLDLTAEEALDFFTEKKIRPVLQAMNDVGLTYLKLGQPLSTLSGGEGQRLKLATELHKRGSVYVLDEPTTGLHLSDIGLLLRILNQLAEARNTVIVIEHHLDVIRQADWIIDLGPDGGSAGGEILFAGPPYALKQCARSITAQFI